MKANKALKRLAKIEALMSDVTERYSSAPHILEVLQDAKAAVIRAKEAVGLQASSGKAKNPTVKHSKPSSKAKPEPSKPKRKLSAAGRKAIIAATKKRWALKRAEAAKGAKTAAKKPAKKAAAKKTAVKAAPAKAAKKTVAKRPQKMAPASASTVAEAAQ
jgi:hypothetical protein